MSSLRVWYSRKFQRLFKQKKNSLKFWKGSFRVIIFLTAVLSFFSICIAVSLSITSSTAPSLLSNSFRAAVWISAKRLSKSSICDSVSKDYGQTNGKSNMLQWLLTLVPSDPVGAKAEGLHIDNILPWVGPSVSVSKIMWLVLLKLEILAYWTMFTNTSLRLYLCYYVHTTNAWNYKILWLSQKNLWILCLVTRLPSNVILLIGTHKSIPQI